MDRQCLCHYERPLCPVRESTRNCWDGGCCGGFERRRHFFWLSVCLSVYHSRNVIGSTKERLKYARLIMHKPHIHIEYANYEMEIYSKSCPSADIHRLGFANNNNIDFVRKSVSVSRPTYNLAVISIFSCTAILFSVYLHNLVSTWP